MKPSKPSYLLPRSQIVEVRPQESQEVVALSWNLRNRNFSAEIHFLEPQRVKRSCGYLEGLQNGEEIHHWDMVWGTWEELWVFFANEDG